MKIPTIVTRSNSYDIDTGSQNDSEAGSCASSGESGDEADIEDSNESEAPSSLSSNDIAAKQKSRKREHPSHLCISISTAGDSASGSGSGSGGNRVDGGHLRLPDSEGESSYHSASVEKERTRLREKGKENAAGKDEKDALRILDMVRKSEGMVGVYSTCINVRVGQYTCTCTCI